MNLPTAAVAVAAMLNAAQSATEAVPMQVSEGMAPNAKTEDQLTDRDVRLRAAVHTGLEATIQAMVDGGETDTNCVITVILSTRDSDVLMSTDQGPLIPQILARILYGDVPGEVKSGIILPPSNNIQKAG